jgi:hypothetical protein
LNYEQDARLARDEGIALRGWVRRSGLRRIGVTGQLISRINYMHDVGMNLPQGDNAHLARANGSEEFLPVIANELTRVPICESQIEHFFASVLAAARRYQLTRTARSGAEAVDQPFEPRKRRSFEHLKGVNSTQIPFRMGCRAKRRCWPYAHR